ncbi:MAG TPA: hypothetical protein VLA62_09050 [Solirubrobacterales bacterium]|nr:hypothetical protein [Solirubrobacterales bacterium]
MLSRRGQDGRFAPIEDLREASKVAVAQLGFRGPRLIQPGSGKALFLWAAYEQALESLPPRPTWPTWSPQSGDPGDRV